MRVVITGGTGLIGSAFSEHLVGLGDEVIVLTRAPNEREAPPGVRLVRWDGRSSAGWADLVEGAGAIVNFAGAGLADKRWSATRKVLLRDSRIDAGSAVASAVMAASERPKVVLQASAIGYYGPRGDEELVESDPPGTDFAAELCKDWEQSSRDVERVGVRHVVLRTGLVLTPAGGVLGRMLPVFRLGLGGRLGTGRQWMSWIHMDDTVRAFDFLMRNDGASGPFNVVAPNPVRNSEFTRELGRAVRRPAPWIVPEAALRLLTGEIAGSLVTGQRLRSKLLEDAGYAFDHPDLGAALRHLLR